MRFRFALNPSLLTMSTAAHGAGVHRLVCIVSQRREEECFHEAAYHTGFDFRESEFAFVVDEGAVPERVTNWQPFLPVSWTCFHTATFMPFLYNLKKSGQFITLKKSKNTFENVPRELSLPFHQSVAFMLQDCCTRWMQCRGMTKEGKPVKDRTELTSKALLRAQALTLNK